MHRRIEISDLDPEKIYDQAAIDTETSGLYVDSGARISTISMAWIDTEGYWERTHGLGQEIWPGGISTIREETINPDTGETAIVVSVAYPIDQGSDNTGKPEDSGLVPLWTDTENISLAQYILLIAFIVAVGKAHGWIYQNAKFDLAMFEAGTRRWPGQGTVDLLPYLVWDTQNISDMLWSMHGTASLKPTADRIYGEGESDEQQVIKSYLAKKKLPSGRWDLMPWDVIAKYADQDARVTLRIAIYQGQLLEEMFDNPEEGWLDGQDGRMDVWEAADRRLRTTAMLRRIERRGLPFDVAGALETADEVDERVLEIRERAPFRPVTEAMAKHYWFGDGEVKGVRGLGLHPYATTDKGAPSIAKDAMRDMVAAGFPFAEDWARMSQLEDANSRWYRGWSQRAGQDGRLRTSIRQNGTVSGRFSVENIQLQAIPHDYRLGGAFEGLRSPRTLIADGAPEGYQLWELDLAQAELRVAARYAKCKPMLELILAGADLHGETAKQLFKVDPASSEWGMWRNVAKRGNFSFIFGIGWEEFQRSIKKETGIELGEAESRTIVKDWNGLYPQYRRAIRTHSDVVIKRMQKHGVGWLTMPNGERRWFTERDTEFDWNGNKTVHKAFNQRVQPSLAQFGIDLWLQSEQLLMDEYGDDPYPGAGRIGMVLMIHDSQVLLLPKGHEEPVKRIKALGSDLWDEWFPGVPGALDAKKWGSD